MRVSNMEKLSKLKPAFVKPNGTVTAANASYLVRTRFPCVRNLSRADPAIWAKKGLADWIWEHLIAGRWFVYEP